MGAANASEADENADDGSDDNAENASQSTESTADTEDEQPQRVPAANPETELHEEENPLSSRSSPAGENAASPSPSNEPSTIASLGGTHGSTAAHEESRIDTPTPECGSKH